MEVITNLQDCTPVPDGVITVGTFDGIHNAHRKIIQEVLNKAKKLHVPSTVVTFDPHPRLVIKKNNNQPVWILATTQEKISLLSKFGLDRVVIIPFTEKFSQTTAEDFISEVLCKTVGMQCLVIGYDHGFGRNRSGNSEFLRQLEKKYEFEVSIEEPVSNHYGVISSSRIREFVLQGAVRKAFESLGRYYSLSGYVVQGDGRGRSINYPTANINVNHPNKCIPENGVYVVQVVVQGSTYNGVMNIGKRPTFGGQTRSLEVHILDFFTDLYDEITEIHFLERIRSEQKFESPELLRQQINADVEFARNYLQQSTVGKNGN